MHFERKHRWLAQILACFIAVISGIAYLGGSTEPSEKLSASERQSALNVADDLLVASALVADERGLALTALSTIDPIGLMESAAIKERRTLADGAMARTQMHLVHLMHSVPNATWEKIMSKIAVAHEQIRPRGR